jgi:hypothetical protein
MTGMLRKIADCFHRERGGVLFFTSLLLPCHLRRFYYYLSTCRVPPRLRPRVGIVVCSLVDSPQNCYGDCIWSNDNCINKTCTHFFGRTECVDSDDNCVWTGGEDEFSGICSNEDTGEDCSDYDEVTCPRPRCGLQQDESSADTRPVCATSTCADFRLEGTCNAAPSVLSCEWKFDQFCVGKCCLAEAGTSRRGRGGILSLPFS